MAENANEPQTGSEIAVAYGPRDRTRNWIKPDGMLENADRVLARYGAGRIEAYEDLLRDDQVKSAFEQRRTSVTSANWSVMPGGESAIDKEAADWLTVNLERIGWDDITDLALYGVFYGFSVAELLWDVFDGRFGWRAIKVRDRSRFEFTADGRCFLDTTGTGEAGDGRIYCEAPYFWTFDAGADHSDNPHGRGLAYNVFWPVRFKRDGIRWWLIYLEKFGMPTAVGKFPDGSNVDTRTRLLEALRAVQTETGIIIPDSTKMEFLEATRGGASDYEAFYRRQDAAIQKAIIGQTLTSEVGETGGNRALGGVHLSVRQDLVKGDADLICESFNRGPVRWLTDYNFAGAAYPRVVREIEQGEDLDKLAQQWERLFRIGFEPTEEMVQELFGAGMVKRPKPATPPAFGMPPANAGRPDGGDNTGDDDEADFAAAVSAMFADQAVLDGGLDVFAQRLAEIGDRMTAPILAYAANHTPGEMAAALAHGFPGWKPAQVYDALARVMFVARTLGRAHGAD